jgi:hypothetical protein
MAEGECGGRLVRGRCALNEPCPGHFDGTRRALKEMIINVERLVEQAERVLRRAQERLDELEACWPSAEDS